MGFADELKAFTVKANARLPEVVATAAVLAHESVVFGSVITGAPGQPVDTGNERNSWQLEQESPTRWLTSTPVEYAPAIEDAVGPHGPVVYGAKNGIGGSHSVKTTVAGGQKLVDEAARRVIGMTGGA